MTSTEAEAKVLTEARTGFTDGRNYDEHRPTYTEEVMEETMRMLLTDVSSGQGFEYDVLELGAGTGKFTRKLLEKVPTNFKVLISEPMGDFLSTLKASSPKANTLQFAANTIPLPDHSVQAIVAAQCFHWFADTDSMDEMKRVLKPGGNLVVLWNILDDRDSDGIAHAFFTLSKPWRAGAVQYVDRLWEKALNDYNGINVKERRMLEFKREMTIESFIQFCSTISFFHRMKPEVRSDAYDKIRNLLRTHTDTKGQEKFIIPFYTNIILCQTDKR